MVGVAQLVRAPGCGPGGWGFKSPRSPHRNSKRVSWIRHEPAFLILATHELQLDHQEGVYAAPKDE